MDNNEIILHSYDFSIGEFLDKMTGEKKEIARLDNRLAFSDTFITSLKEKGVEKFVRANE